CINEHPKCTRRQLMQALAPALIQPPAESPAAAAASAEPSAEETQIVSDLHWLIHQGQVIEFANGILETAKKPTLKPPKPDTTPAAEAVSTDGAGPVAAQPSELTRTGPGEITPRTDGSVTAPGPLPETSASPTQPVPGPENASFGGTGAPQEDLPAGPAS